ncbi:MAG: SDR family oxidoreductase [Eubacteriales bacterium]|nr:SDR family oxidoreductase [Eubacteriales bacterium]
MLTRDSFPRLLEQKTVLLTGAGGGIGMEAALAFAAMGARVILAEIDPVRGKRAEETVNAAYPASAAYYEIDLSSDEQIRGMVQWITTNYGAPDVLFHNATVTKMGAVDQVDVSYWDKSYAVNLRAPLLLTQLFLPQMKARNSGAVAFVSSSGASPFMGAYEVFKTAQVELGNTLAMELEETDVSVYTIGPGLVKTETAMRAIEVVAGNMGMTTDAFYEMNGSHIIGADAAGLGFALSAVYAQRYRGQEIGCIQVLMDCGVFEDKAAETPSVGISGEQMARFARIRNTFLSQYDGWQRMNLFERQWVFRDFKKCMALSAEQAGDELCRLSESLSLGQVPAQKDLAFLERLKAYWEHQLQLLKGYEKSASKLEENTRVIGSWIDDIAQFLTGE